MSTYQASPEDLANSVNEFVAAAQQQNVDPIRLIVLAQNVERLSVGTVIDIAEIGVLSDSGAMGALDRFGLAVDQLMNTNKLCPDRYDAQRTLESIAKMLTRRADTIMRFSHARKQESVKETEEKMSDED